MTNEEWADYFKGVERRLAELTARHPPDAETIQLATLVNDRLHELIGPFVWQMKPPPLTCDRPPLAFRACTGLIG